MIAYLALGSNEGDRVGYLQQALQHLRFNKKITVLSASSFYETEPLGDLSQRWFVNATVAIDTDLNAQELLNICLQIEENLGRVRDPENQMASRTIDMDILFFGTQVIDRDDLQVPHPRMHERACVLVPMLELNARLIHPVIKKSMMQLHRELEYPELVFLYGTLPRDLDTFYPARENEA